MKGDILLKVLQVAGEGAVTLSDLFVAFLEAGYGASYGKLEYELRIQRKERARAEEEQKARERFQKFFYKLKRDNLITTESSGMMPRFSITRRGRSRLAGLLKWQKNRLPDATYEVKRTNIFTIVAFDVPEKERKKRAWLREALRNLGFNRVQQSVWIGKVKIPKPFVEDIERLKLLEAVEIFEITKTGSLRHPM